MDPDRGGEVVGSSRGHYLHLNLMTEMSIEVNGLFAGGLRAGDASAGVPGYAVNCVVRSRFTFSQPSLSLFRQKLRANGGGQNILRLNFSNASPEQIVEGIRRLAAVARGLN